MEKALGRIIKGLFPFLLFLFSFLIEGIRPSWHKVIFPTVIPAGQKSIPMPSSPSPAPDHSHSVKQSTHRSAHLSLQQSSPHNGPTEK